MVGNGDLLGFGPVLGRRHLEKFRARAENRKTQFPGARGPETEKKVTTLSGTCPQLSYSLRFDRPDPHRQENAKYEDVGSFWPRTAVGTWRNPRPGPKTENRNFLALGGPK